MKKILIILIVIAILAGTGIYLLGGSSDLQGRFNGKVKNSMEAENNDEFKGTTTKDGMEAENNDE